MNNDRRINVWRVLAALCLSLGALLAQAQSPSPAPSARPDPKDAWAQAREASLQGPQDIKLLEQAVLKLPADRVFIPQPQAEKLLQAMGNPGNDPRLQGLIFPKSDQGWFMTVRYEASGYIKDDDAKDWNADDLLKSYREGTEAANEERAKMGAPALEILGWAEKPVYDSPSHRLAWAMSSRERGGTAADQQGVNYNTYLLGRDGYFSLNLVTDLKDLGSYKPSAQSLLASLNFNQGKRYADFNASTDHMAEFGLAALVVGVGAKKLGLLAVIGVFLAKFAKIIVLAVLGFGGAFTRFFRGRKGAE